MTEAGPTTDGAAPWRGRVWSWSSAPGASHTRERHPPEAEAMPEPEHTPQLTAGSPSPLAMQHVRSEDHTGRAAGRHGGVRESSLRVRRAGGARVGGARAGGARVGGARVGGARVGGARVGGTRAGGPHGWRVRHVLAARARMWVARAQAARSACVAIVARAAGGARGRGARGLLARARAWEALPRAARNASAAHACGRRAWAAHARERAGCARAILPWHISNSHTRGGHCVPRSSLHPCLTWPRSALVPRSEVGVDGGA